MAEGETPSFIIMGKNYKEELEREWGGRSLAEMRIKAAQLQVDRNITNLLKDKKRRYR